MKKLILLAPLLLMFPALLTGCASDDSGSTDSSIEAPSAEKKAAAAPATPTGSLDGPKRAPSELSKALSDKNYNEMFKIASDMLLVNPNDPQALNALAIYHIQKSEWGAARLLLERAIEKNKDMAGLHNNLGVIALKEDNLESALAHFKTAYEKDSRNGNVNNNLGSIYVKYLDYGKAQGMIESAYSSSPESVSVTNNYAIIQRYTGNYEKAAELYKKNLAKESRNVSTMINYAILLIDYMKKYDEGERILNKLEFLESNDPAVKNKMAELNEKLRAARK
ncbi:MAG: tetratricopeptide repeat protein [Bdellovibrionales bacterium]|nr:tetratricopeptide repeat protein [Bdellovibrionales bacterium]